MNYQYCRKRKMSEKARKEAIRKKLKRLVKSDNHSSEVLIPKIFVSRAPIFKPEEGFQTYISASYKERKKYLRKLSVPIEPNEIRKMRSAHYEIEEKIFEDPHLRHNIEIFPQATDKCIPEICQVLGKRAILSQVRKPSKKSNYELTSETLMKLLDYIPVYTPPRRRIRVIPNLTFNSNNVIPVYSDLPDESVKTIEIPDSLLFDYIDVNFVNLSTEIDLARAVKMSEKDQNMIRCKCCSGESIIPCYKNEECPCYVLNRMMQEYQPDKTAETVFTSFDPIYFNGMEKMYGKHFGFACSELCSCKGNCTNNTMLIVEKQIFPFEVYRSNEKMGFGVRCPVLIPAGTPVMEFVGEICSFNRDSSDYSFQVTYDYDKDICSLVPRMKFTENYKSLLIKLHSKNYFVDPKMYGNVGRMVCHSCSANLEMIRIFQKSLSPAHIRLVLVSIIDIYPGTPLTFDYGYEYVKQQFNDQCLCGTFVCKNGKDSKIYTKLTEENFLECYKQLDVQQYADWDKKVYKPVCDSKGSEEV